jgi:hypothetical protein
MIDRISSRSFLVSVSVSVSVSVFGQLWLSNHREFVSQRADMPYDHFGRTGGCGVYVTASGSVWVVQDFNQIDPVLQHSPGLRRAPGLFIGRFGMPSITRTERGHR